MVFLYNIVIRIYYLLIYISSAFHPKARLWIKGRKNLIKQIENSIKPKEERAWFHFASLGEFEQGRTVLEQFKNEYPTLKIVITFFSPSGFEVRKNYANADYIFYLPLDTVSNASKFIEIIKPKIVFFTKYDFWYHYFRIIHQKNIPLYLISAIFRPNQLFFKKYGSFYQNILRYVTFFFVQNQQSANLLTTIGLNNYLITGDTRFDRVLENKNTTQELPLIKTFSNGNKVIVAGSTWKEDEEIIYKSVNNNSHNFKWIIAPHEITSSTLGRLKKMFRANCVFYSEARIETISNYKILIIDNVGLLMSIYHYAYLAYIGGGFGKGIHNILEAAAFGIPVIFGPNFKKFNEAHELLKIEGAFTVKNSKDFEYTLKKFTSDAYLYKKACKENLEYVRSHTGSTSRILQHIKHI